MKTFTNPKESGSAIGEFTYEGCRYSGIELGMTFSVISEGLANFLVETFPFLEEAVEPAPVAENKFCCSRCGRDCKSSYMKERHEKACKEAPKNMATILKPIHIFWNYRNLDRTQLTEDQLLPNTPNEIPKIIEETMTEAEIAQPMPGKPGKSMIGKHEENVITDGDGIEWYGGGLEDDTV